MLNKNTYFQTDPLVARKFIVAPCPYSLIVEDFINTYYPENKGIREEGIAVIQATKGALENKVFFDIQSNSLNLPRLIQIYNPVADARNEYIYSASGQKLKVLHIWDPYFQTTPILGTDENFGSPVMMTITDYVGNMIYENNTVLKRILIDGGYIEGGQYYYYLTDHLGNNRVVANASGAVVQKNHYYPFGVAFAETSVAEQGKQPYKFGGKELDQMNGLNLYDYLARLYDPAIGRTLTLDPMCEIYYPMSPYAYCANNPVNLVDPTGMIWDSTSVAEVNNLKTSLENRIDKLNKQIKDHTETIKSGEIYDDQIDEYVNEISDFEDMVSNLKKSVKDIDRLGEDKKHTYVLDSKTNPEDGYVLRKQNGKISIVGDGGGLTVHEITHIKQSLDAGNLNFDPINKRLQYISSNVEIQANQEVEAYQRQFSVRRTVGFVPGFNILGPNEITPQMIGTFKKANGTYRYPAIHNKYDKN